ncbi:polysaccharide deacetylase family protein [Thermoanaerobacterium sp. RBIITD]|uniref:polysaccharide deacetylase family protein n=1 Tax=Thermoanaerobacterium sp. RBIITD TaxID=1550240 RepID=UPI000BB88B34|nr:polysaccharide deacetylase family protein [Thermoanaerobacterium sp. RBIITD]SNX54330.1 Polysaccharide deacetylase [Thermoanaerobacterium sp. RBIITD]
MLRRKAILILFFIFILSIILTGSYNKSVNTYKKIPSISNSNTSSKTSLKKSIDPNTVVKNNKTKNDNTIGLNVTTPNSLQSSQSLDTQEYATEIPVLMYHHILKKSENKFNDNEAIINAEDFEEEMKVLHDNNYKTATLKELEQFVKCNLKLPKKTVVITFDDGYLSNYIYTYPILKKYGFKASIFVITGNLKNESSLFDPSGIQYLSYKEMLLSSDVFSFESHTRNLHDLVAPGKTRLLASSDDIVINDLTYSRNLLNSSYFAYPYGLYTNHLIDILKNIGYTMAFTMEKGYVKPNDNPFTLKRQFIGPKTTLDQFKKIIQLNN